MGLDGLRASECGFAVPWDQLEQVVVVIRAGIESKGWPACLRCSTRILELAVHVLCRTPVTRGRFPCCREASLRMCLELINPKPCSKSKAVSLVCCILPTGHVGRQP